MAEKVTCTCGRRFHIGNGSSNVQCRGCARTWVKCDSTVAAFGNVLRGGEIAKTQKVEGTRPKTSRSHTGKQTSKHRPKLNPIGSVLRYFFG